MRGEYKFQKYLEEIIMPETYKEFCSRVYQENFDREFVGTTDGHHSAAAITSSRLNSQRKAIDKTFIEALLNFPDANEDVIWAAIGNAHKVNIAKLDDFDIPSTIQEGVIKRCLSAHQSWIKTGGHSFERYISNISNPELERNEIRFILQSELTKLIKDNSLVNTPDDIQGLKDWGKDFDLYAIQTVHGQTHVFGCIQSKTSIRDRVGRDVTFSHNAMDGLFWSVAVTLDGAFLNMPEFIHMVNGGGSYTSNGWHGMYAMSGIDGNNGRIYGVDDSLSLFITHAIIAARQFISDRRLLNNHWSA